MTTDTRKVEIPTEFTFQEESTGIESYRFDTNGLEVLLLPQDVAPVTCFMVTYRVGSRNEVPGRTGATHLLEHLMFKGTERYNRERGTSIFQVLQRVGARVNASTWFDRTNYFEMLPEEHLPLAIEIEADRMRNALVRAQDLEQERTVVLNELDRGENNPRRKLYHSVWSTAFYAHPYHHPTIGWRSDVSGMSAEDLRHYYDTYYWPNNATISVIGSFDRREVLREIKEQFEHIPAQRSGIPEVTTTEPPQQGERRVTVRQPGQVGMVMLGFKSPPGLEADADALAVLANVLSSGKNSRLYRTLTDEGLTTGVHADTSRLKDPGLFLVFASLAPGVDHREVEEVIRREVERVKREGITEEELERAVNQQVAEQAYGRDGPYAVARQLNEAIAAGDWKLYTELIDRTKTVTREDVRQAAEKYIALDQMTAGYYIPTNQW